MDCPNNRYVNDELICKTVVQMLAKVGIKVDLLAQPKAQFFAKILRPKRDMSMYLLGWTPGSFDSWNVLFNLHGTPNKDTGRGKFNVGGYGNPKVDALIDRILVETDTTKRDAMIRVDAVTANCAYVFSVSFWRIDRTNRSRIRSNVPSLFSTRNVAFVCAADSEGERRCARKVV